MKNILIIYDQIDNTVEVNLTILRALFDVDYLSIQCQFSKSVTKHDLNGCDVCLAIRPSSLYSYNIAKSIKASGRKLVTLFDDDLLNITKSSSLFWRIKYMKSCLALSDCVIIGNAHIQESYKQYAPHALFVLSNTFVRESDILPVQPAGDVVKIVYAAGRDHTPLFDEFVKPEIETILKKYGDKVELHIMGIEPDLSGIDDSCRIIRHQPRSYEAYMEFMCKNHFDIGLAPLHDDSFSNKKYFRKYIDYAQFGVLGLYSKCLPYTLVVKDGYNGLYVGNTPKEWYKSITYAIDNIASLKSLVQNSQEHLLNEFSYSAVKKHFLEELSPLLNNNSVASDVAYKKSFAGSALYEFKFRYYQVKASILAEGVVKTIRKII